MNKINTENEVNFVVYSFNRTVRMTHIKQSLWTKINHQILLLEKKKILPVKHINKIHSYLLIFHRIFTIKNFHKNFIIKFHESYIDDKNTYVLGYLLSANSMYFNTVYKRVGYMYHMRVFIICKYFRWFHSILFLFSLSFIQFSHNIFLCSI